MKSTHCSALAAAILILTALQAKPAQAQARVFVAAQGTDSNPCTFALPCRTFQHAHNIVGAGGEIDVLDPAGYGALTISKAISIQGHGFSGITQAAGAANAITIQAGATDVIHLHGLLIDGAGTGFRGIEFDSGASLEIVDCVVRHFIGDGILLSPSTDISRVSITNVLASDNGVTGVNINVPDFKLILVSIDRTITDNNKFGVYVNTGQSQFNLAARVMIVDSVSSNNATYGYNAQGWTMLQLDGVATVNNQTGVATHTAGHIDLGHSRNNDGLDCSGGGAIASFGDNRISAPLIGIGACFTTSPSTR